MAQNTEHQQLVNAILSTIGSMPEVRLWPRAVGVGKDARGNFVRYGIKGESDIDGILKGGRRVSIEVKTGNGKLSDDQIRWKNMIEKFGGLYIEARSLEQVVEIIKKNL